LTPHQILIVAIRLLAIFWLLSVLSQVPVVVATFEHTEAEPFATFGWLGIQFSISVVLWLFPATFARLLLRSGNTPVTTANTPLGEWHVLCFVAVGVFILARAVPELVYWLIVASDRDPLAAPFRVDQKAGLVATLVEVAVGVTLVLGATGLSSLVHRLRRAGVPAGQ
jgi:hypothetical protein